MKTTRIGLTMTMTVPEDVELGTLNDEAIKGMLYDSARSKNPKEFSEDLAIWHSAGGSVDETELNEDSLELCDRAVIAQMDREKAVVILNHPQTLKAMMLVFGQLIGSPDQLAAVLSQGASEEPAPDAETENTSH